MPPPKEAQRHLKNANELVAKRRFNAAFNEFEMAIRRDYGNSRAHYDFGAALLKAGRFPKAVEQFRKAVEFDPEDLFNVTRLVEALLHDIRQDQDLEDFQKTVDKADRADLRNRWARVLAKLQRSDQALEQFKLALKKDPELKLVTDSLVQAFNDSSTTEQQIKEFQDEVDKLNNEYAWNTWGKTLFELGKYDLAAKQFEKAASVRNDWAEAHMNRGKALIELKDHQQAIDVLGKALTCDKNFENAYLYRGIALNQIGEHQKAVSNYQLGAAKAPADEYFAPWLESLRELPASGRAIAAYRKALEKSIFAGDACFSFGEFLKERGRLPESAIQFARALAFDDLKTPSRLQETLSDLADPQPTLEAIQKIFDKADEPEQYIEWGKVLARMDQVDRARDQLSKVMPHLSSKRVPFELLKDLVLAFKSSEDRNIVEDDIRKALSKLNNGKLAVKWARILVKDLNNYEQALAMFRNVLITPPASDGLTEGFAEALQTSPNQSSVINDIQAAVDKAADAAVFYQWALILIKLGRKKLAIDTLQQAIRLGNTDAHYQLALIYDKQGNYRKACREFQKAESNHHLPLAIQNWGTTLLKAGRREEAIQKYLQALRQGGNVLDIHDRLNWDNDLVERFQKVVDEVDTAKTYYQWGGLLRGIKRPELAIEQFKRAINIDPDERKSYSEWLKALGTWGLSPERLSDYERCIVKYRDDAASYVELGNFLYDLNWTDQAAQKNRQALERDPRHRSAHSKWIHCLILANDINQARKEARKLLTYAPNSESAYVCLSFAAFLDGDYDEAIKQVELGIENGVYLYNIWAWALYKSGREDLARKKFEEALEKEPNNFNTLTQQGLLLMEMGRYDAATAAFRTVVDLKPDHLSAHHNLATIAYNQGRYEEAWENAKRSIEVYELRRPLLARVIEKNEFVDSYESFHHASLILVTQPHKSQEAERILEEGRNFDPNNTGILGALAKLNWERKEEFVDPGSEINRRKSDCHWDGMGYFQGAEKLLREKLQRYSNHYYLQMELGELYITREDYDQARPCFEAARALDKQAYLPYAKLGVISLRERQLDKAIPLLQEALKRNPNDLDVKSNLAEAYLRAEKLDEAETTYREVLNVAPNHVQSYIGLGEVCAALGDKKDFDRYLEGIDHFTTALRISRNEKIRSKYLKRQEEAAVYYQCGYAHVQLYESSGIRRDTKLLKHAQKDFASCLALNPSHQKAIRSKEKIDKRLGYFSRDRLTETIGPLTIYSMSIIILLAVQLAFFAMPFFNQPSLVVSDKSLQAVAKQVAPEVVQSLETLKNQKFGNREAPCKRASAVAQERCRKGEGRRSTKRGGG